MSDNGGAKYRLTDGSFVWVVESQPGFRMFFTVGGYDDYAFMRFSCRVLADDEMLLVGNDGERVTVGAMRDALSAYDALAGGKGAA